MLYNCLYCLNIGCKMLFSGDTRPFFKKLCLWTTNFHVKLLNSDVYRYWLTSYPCHGGILTYRKIAKISPSKYKPPKLVTQKTHR